MKKQFLATLLALGMAFTLGGCAKGGIEDFQNPGDVLGGGGNVVIGDDAYDITDIENRVDDIKTEVPEEDETPEPPVDCLEVDLSTITSDYQITASGSYIFKGTTDKKIVIAKKSLDLHIFLNDATFDSIFSDKKPNSTIITLSGKNTMTGRLSDANADSKGTLYIKNDLTINGSGSLKINADGEDKNGVHCTGALKISGVSMDISANKNGVRGNLAVLIDGASITAKTVSGDGIQTDNEQEYAEGELESPSKDIGYVYVNNSTLKIECGDDGIQAATSLVIDSGNIDIKTNGGAPSSVTESSHSRMNGKGLKAGSVTFTDKDGKAKEVTDYTYYSLVINGGDINLNCNDDAIHSNGTMLIKGGNITAVTGDDGVHADEFLRIDGGSIDIQKCYEGVEAAKIEIYGGDVKVVAVDDGVNAADGTDGMFRPGMANTHCYMIIGGGNLAINAQGDGLDSNGTMEINGGTVYVDGPSASMNAALDSDGGILINGGTVVAVGSLSMVETPGSNSKQNVVSYASATQVSAGSTISVKDSKGATVLSFTTAKTCQSIIFSCPDLTKGETYTLYNGSTLVTTFTISSTITTIGTQNMGGGNRPGGGMPGWGIGGRR